MHCQWLQPELKDQVSECIDSAAVVWPAFSTSSMEVMSNTKAAASLGSSALASENECSGRPVEVDGKNAAVSRLCAFGEWGNRGIE